MEPTVEPQPKLVVRVMRESSPSTQAGWKRCPTPRLRLRISAPAETAVRAGHPWIFAESIRQQNRDGKLGELAVVFDRHDKFLALGLFDPESPLRVRLLHAGKPITVDHDWWAERLRHSIARRHGLFEAETNGYRWINGESDGWPGLVLDRYASTLVLKIYTAAWLPWLEEIVEIVRAELAPERLVLRLSRNIRSLAERAFCRLDGQILMGPELEGSVVFLETGLRFEADVLRGQKTGFFLDQRENRRLVEALAHGRDVLNAFSFCGGFSLYAARGGATSAADLDISPHALESATRNFSLNRSAQGVAACRHETIQADAFAWLENNRARKFDLVILDPPSLAKREAERARALRAYARLARNAMKALRPGGILVAASCSAHVSAVEFFETIRKSAVTCRRKFEEIRTTAHPLDHPATFAEAHYLKCIYLRILK